VSRDTLALPEPDPLRWCPLGPLQVRRASRPCDRSVVPLWSAPESALDDYLARVREHSHADAWSACERPNQGLIEVIASIEYEARLQGIELALDAEVGVLLSASLWALVLWTQGDLVSMAFVSPSWATGMCWADTAPCRQCPRRARSALAV
jgi:hypothetical protein